MRHVVDNKTLKGTLLRSGIALCLFHVGCGGRFVKSVDEENTFVRTDRYDRAILELSRVLEKNPQNARAYYERGLIYYEKGQYDKAWQDVRTAQGLGYEVPAVFLRLLSETSGDRR